MFTHDSYERQRDLTRKTGRYIEVKPQIFCIGDIMEAQCSMAFIKPKEGTARMKVILRAIVLVNSNHSSVSNTMQERDDSAPNMFIASQC